MAGKILLDHKVSRDQKNYSTLVIMPNPDHRDAMEKQDGQAHLHQRMKIKSFEHLVDLIVAVGVLEIEEGEWVDFLL